MGRLPDALAGQRHSFWPSVTAASAVHRRNGHVAGTSRGNPYLDNYTATLTPPTRSAGACGTRESLVQAIGVCLPLARPVVE
jgi:hypothetical protein